MIKCFTSYILLLFTLIAVLSCDENKTKDFKNDVILQTIDSAINNFTYNSLDSQLLTHEEYYKSKVKGLVIRKLLERDSNSFSKEELIIIKKLQKTANDTVKFKFKEPFHFKNNVIIEAESYSSDSIPFGFIRLTDPQIYADTLACYYLDLNCFEIAGSCSVGYLVMVSRRKEEKWKLYRIIELWVEESREAF